MIIQPWLLIIVAISLVTNVMGLIILPKIASIDVKRYEAVPSKCHARIFHATKWDTLHLNAQVMG